MTIAIHPETLVSPDIQRLFAGQTANCQAVGRTTYRERRDKLSRLYDVVLRNRQAIREAVWADFQKNATEADFSETGIILSEIRHAIRNLRSWMRPTRVSGTLTQFGTRSEIRYESKGVCLIISPWNYPFNLTLAPLVSAIAAGNCVIIKPSEYTPHSSAVMKRLLAEVFPPEEVALAEGDAAVAKELLTLPFNHIFFTGSPAVGKLVMKAASEHLASVTLELGGKSPVIVDASADLDLAASRLAWVKSMNTGQICIAPDYVLVHESIHDALVEKIKEKLAAFYGNTPEAIRRNPDLPRVINTRHYDRLLQLLNDALQRGAHPAFGGEAVREECYICPTVLTGVPEDADIWQEEIFGPLLPVRSYKTTEEALNYINASERPLSLYIFSNSKTVTEHILRETRAGGGCVNDIAFHFYHPNLPFGGVNNSGLGKSHGKFGFLEFSNQRGLLYQNRIFPLTNLFLPPYGKNKLATMLLEGIVKWF